MKEEKLRCKSCNEGHNELTNPSAGSQEQNNCINSMLELRVTMAPVLSTR